MKIGKKLKRLREIYGFTQEAMAEKLDMTVNGYAQIERDIGNPNLRKIERIANIFDFSVLEFLDFCENGASFYISSEIQQTSNNNSNNYYIFGKNGYELLMMQLEKAELVIKHKDELLLQKQAEIDLLKEILKNLK